MKKVTHTEVPDEMEELGYGEGVVGDAAAGGDAEEDACDDAVDAEKEEEGEDCNENIISVLGEVGAEDAGYHARHGHLVLKKGGDVRFEARTVRDWYFARLGYVQEMRVGSVWKHLGETHRGAEGESAGIGTKPAWGMRCAGR